MSSRRNHRKLRLSRRLGRPLPLCHRAWPHARTASSGSAYGGQQGSGLCQPGLAGVDGRPDRAGRAGPDVPRRQRRAYRPRPRGADRDALFGQDAVRDPEGGRLGSLRSARPLRASDAPAHQWHALDGRAHHTRCPPRSSGSRRLGRSRKRFSAACAGAAGQGPSAWRGWSAPWRNLARPSGSPGASPISPGIHRATYYTVSASGASAT